MTHFWFALILISLAKSTIISRAIRRENVILAMVKKDDHAHSVGRSGLRSTDGALVMAGKAGVEGMSGYGLEGRPGNGGPDCV